MKMLTIFVLFILLFSSNVMATHETTAPIWTVGSASRSPSEVSAGGTVSIAVPITNNAENTDYTCTISIGSVSTSKQVFTGRTEELTLQVAAPSYATTSQQTKTVNVQVECSGIWDKPWPLHDVSVYGELTRSTSYKWPTQAEIIELQQKTQAESAKNAASSAISSANSAINSANNRINEASNIGADVSSATQHINSAQSDYSSANTLLSSGNSAYNSKDYNSAKSYYQQAQSKASSAQTSAANAKSMVDQIIEEYNRKKTEAQNKVSDSNSAIDTAKQRIDAADKVISDATIIGLDTAQAKADVATARSKIDTAEDYYSEASNMFSAGNFESAKSKAESAIGLADQAEELATSAYNVLQERLTVAGESSKAILEANSEISQMNEILTKMDYIVRNVEKWGVSLADMKAVTTEAKTNVDNAEDLLSQAKNRQDSGEFNPAINSANQARDKAASSRNRLDTMTHTISLSVQDSLDKAYADLKGQLGETLSEVKSAQGTYGATPELVVDAQNDLLAANNKLKEAESLIQNVKTANDLMPLLEKAEAAFQSLEATQEKVNSAKSNAKNAKLGLAKKVGAGAAVAIAAGGGGFLYYRRKKKKKEDKKKKPVSTKKLAEEIKEEEEQIKGEQLDEGISKKQIKKEKEFVAEEKEELEEKKHKNIVKLEKEIEKRINEGQSKKEIINEFKEAGWDKKKVKQTYKTLKKEIKETGSDKKQGDYCKKCGHKLGEEQKFCPGCGKKVR